MAATIDSLDIKITASSADASDAISKLVSSLEKLDEALQKLNIKGFQNSIQKISDSMDKMSKSAANTGAKLENTAKSTSLVSSAFRLASSAGGGLISSLKNMNSHAKSLQSIFMGLYAKLWLIRKLFNAGLKAMTYASDLTEVENVVAHTFEGMSYKLEDFAKTSRQTFGLSELSAKTYASQFQSMLKTMGISAEQVRQVNSSLAQDTDKMASMMSKGYEVVSNDISDMSINLTKLSADMASFYNQESADVASRLQAGVISGQSRALRQYGIDLTIATLNEFAMSKGIQQNVKDMTQAEKTMLRYEYVMDRLSHVQGDFARTMNTWHNQIVLLKQNLQALGGTIGQGLINAFKPAIIKINAAMNTIIGLVEKAMNAIGKLLGWQIEIQEVSAAIEDMDETLEGGGGSGGGSGGGLADDLDDAADGSGDLADGLNDASKAAKKLKDYTFGIDELNIFHPDDIEDSADALDDLADKTNKAKDAAGSGGGGGGAGGGGSTAGNVSGGGVTFKPYESDITSWFDLGQKIGDTLADVLESINWDNIYKKARDFGKGLADFLNGLISPRLFGDLGDTIASSLNTALHFLDSFGETFSWYNFGNSIATGINHFFSTFDFELLAHTLNVWATGLLTTIITILDNTDWYMIGEQIGTFLAALDFTEVGKMVGEAIWKAINAGFDFYKGMFDKAPLEATVLTTLTGIAIASNAVKSKPLQNLVTAIFNGQKPMQVFGDAFGNFEWALSNGLGPMEAAKQFFTTTSKNINPVAKGVLGIATGVLEIVGVSDAISDIITGTGNLSTNILELIGSVGVATAAFALLFGPEGVILAGAGAAAGAVLGLVEAMNEIRAEKIGQDIYDALANPGGVPVEDLISAGTRAIETIKSDLDGLSDELSAFESSKAPIQEVVEEIAKIQASLEAGLTSAQDVIPQLTEKYQELATAITTYLGSATDVLIAAFADGGILAQAFESTGLKADQMRVDVVNAMDEQQRKVYDLTEEIIRLSEVDPTNPRIGELQAELQSLTTESTATQEALDALKVAASQPLDWTTFVNEDGLDDKKFASALSGLTSKTKETKETAESDLQSVVTAAKALGSEEVTSNIETAIPGALAYMNTQIGETATEATDILQNDLVNEITTIMENAQTEWEGMSWYEQIGTGASSAEEYAFMAVTEFKDNYIKPISDEIETQFSDLGIDGAGWADDAADDIIEAFFDVDEHTIYGGANHMTAEFTDAARKALSGAADAIDFSPTGKAMMEGAAQGVTDNTSILTDALTGSAEDGLDAFNEASGVNSPSWKYAESAMYMMEGAAEGVNKHISILEAALVQAADRAVRVFSEALASGLEVYWPLFMEAIAECINVFLYEFLPAYTDAFLYELIPEFMNILFNEILPPYFGVEMWEPLFTMLREMFIEKFQAFRAWFSEDAMKEWWEEDLVPWFDPEKWMGLFENIINTADEAFGMVRDAIREHMLEAVEACSEACQIMMELLAEVAGAISDVMAAIAGMSGALSGFSGITIGVQGFAAGGYPQSGSLFMANEAGAELIGTVGGRTAVANNNEITGIREAVYSTGQAETQLLSQIINLAQQLLDKDPVVLGDRDIALANKRGQSKIGLSLIS